MADLVNGLGHGAKHGGENISKTACYVEKTITIKKRKVKSPFKNMWLRVEGFIDKLKSGGSLTIFGESRDLCLLRSYRL